MARSGDIDGAYVVRTPYKRKVSEEPIYYNCETEDEGHEIEEDEDWLKKVQEEWVASLKVKLEETPTESKSPVSGSSDRFIFGSPNSLISLQPESRQHQNIVSLGIIGHHKIREKYDECKWQFLRSFLHRTNLSIEDISNAIIGVEEKANAYYHNKGFRLKPIRKLDSSKEYYSPKTADPSSIIGLSLSNELRLETKSCWRLKDRKILLVDSCFILELLLKLYHGERNHPFLATPRTVPSLLIDLLKLDNQIPFCILQSLSNIIPEDKRVRLADLVCPLFDSVYMRPPTKEMKNLNEVKHLLDLLHTSFLPLTLDPQGHQQNLDPENPRHEWTKTWSERIPCAIRLQTAGIKFKPAKVSNFLDIEFKKGVLHMSSIVMNDSIVSFLLNCIAYEGHLPNCSRYFSAYAAFMDLLISTEKDVALLCDNRIISNQFGTDQELAGFFNKLGKEIKVDIWNSHLSEQLENASSYYSHNWNEFRASFKDTYFSSPWSLISTIVALVIVLLTILQAIIAVLGYARPPS